MTVTVLEFVAAANALWPEKNAEEWDRVGLICGVPDAQIDTVALCLDATRENVKAAQAVGAKLLFTHHPLLLRGVNSVAATEYKGEIITELIRSEMALYAAHTNADTPEDGVSDVLAKKLGLQQLEPLVPAADLKSGLGRVGQLPAAITLREFVDQAAAIFPQTATGLRVGGDPARKIKRVALLGGAGDSLLNNERVLGADVYMTSDLRHHPAQEFLAQPAAPALIDVAHWAAESLWLESAASQLAKKLPAVKFIVTDVRSDPWQFVVGASGEGV